MKHIFFIRSDRFGEFLLNLAAIKLVKLNNLKTKITLLADKHNIDLVRDTDFIDSFVEYDEAYSQGFAGAVKLAGLLRKHKADGVVILNPNKMFHLAAKLAGVKFRLGYNRKWGFCLNHKIKDEKDLARKHEVNYNIDLVRELCRDVYVPSVDLAVNDTASLESSRDVLDLDARYIVVHPFTSNSDKQISKEFWGELVRKLEYSLKREVVIIGSKKERDEAKEYARLWKVHNLVGMMDLRGLATFLKNNCFMFIGLDSGPMHLASFYDLPIVGLFTVSNDKRWGPLGREVLIIRGKSLTDFRKSIDNIISFAKMLKEREPKI